MSIPRTLVATMLLALPLTGPLALPDRFAASYVLHAGDLEVGTTSIAQSPMGDGRFEYTSFSRATGIASLLDNREVRERSVWELSGSQIRPLRYDYKRRGAKERQVEVVFDPSSGTLTNRVNGETWQMEVPEPTFDRQSHLIALMRDLASGARPESYRVADGGKLKIYHFRHLGPDRVSTALGDLDTVVVERTVPGASRRTTFWLAPSFDYLPVQIEHLEDGTSIIARIREASGFEDRDGED